MQVQAGVDVRRVAVCVCEDLILFEINLLLTRKKQTEDWN